LWDKRTFRALDLKRKRVRIAVISCMDDHLKDVADKMWPQVTGQKPDLMFWIGDNVYSDHVEGKWQDTTPDILWDRYVQTRQDLPVFRAPVLIPVLATWDDHDYGRNDADRTYAYKDKSLEIFFSFFAQKRPGPGLERGPGVASWFSAFNAQFALMDDRYFRSPDKLDVPDQTHFGPDQEKWLNDHLADATLPVWMISGDQWFGGYHRFESYEGSHPKSFQAQLPSYRKSKVPLLFVSGDRHLSEILNVPAEVLGYPTYEVTSSGIHATVFPNAFKENPSPHQLVGVAGVYNYSILELMHSERRLLQISVQAFGPDEKLLYQKTLTVKHP
jgi:alkaline phosphatase D